MPEECVKMEHFAETRKGSAEQARAIFQDLLDVQGRLTLSGLARETLELINPQYTRLRIAYSAVTRNPILAAGVFAGVGWLFKQLA